MSYDFNNIDDLTPFQSEVAAVVGPADRQDVLEEVGGLFDRGRLSGVHADARGAIAVAEAIATTSNDPLEAAIAREEAELAAAGVTYE